MSDPVDVNGSEPPAPAQPEPAGPIARWLSGVLLAAGPVTLGVYSLIVGRAWLLNRRGMITLFHWPAVAMAIAYIGLGLYLHFHYFWEGRRPGWRAARIGKPASVALVVGGLLWVVLELLIGLTNWM